MLFLKIANQSFLDFQDLAEALVCSKNEVIFNHVFSEVMAGSIFHVFHFCSSEDPGVS